MRLRYIDKWVSRPDRDLSPTWSTGFGKLVQDRRLPNKRLKLTGARRLWNESFVSAPQLKRDPLGGESSRYDDSRPVSRANRPHGRSGLRTARGRRRA